MKQILCPLLCLVAIATSSYAETDPGVTVTQYLSSTNLWPMEFICSTVVISNKTDHPIVRNRSAFASWKIRRKDGDDDERRWQTCAWYGPMATPPEPMEFILPSHGILHDFGYIVTDMRGKAYFRKPGVYEIQSGTIFGESQVCEIAVHPLPGDETLHERLPDKTPLLFDEPSFRFVWNVDGDPQESLAWKSLKALHPLENRREYVDWLALYRLWYAKNATKRQNDENDPVFQIAHEIIKRHEGRCPPAGINPIPLFQAYLELAAWYRRNRDWPGAVRWLDEAETVFAEVPAFLYILEWERKSHLDNHL